MVNHSPAKVKGMSWQVCNRCGLVYLNNEITRAAIKYGCDYKEDPNYIKIEKRLFKR